MRHPSFAFLGGLVLAARTGAAAQVALSGVGGLMVAEHRVDAGFGVERTLGPVASAGIVVHLHSRLWMALQASAGSLGARASQGMDRDFGEVTVTAQWRGRSWLAAEVGATARSYSSLVGRQRWILVRTGGEVRVPLAWGGAEGVLRLGYLPVVAVSTLEAPRLAFAAGAGMEYRRGRARLRAVYELERYDFPVTGTANRLEQLSAVSVSLSVRLRRAS